MLAALADEPLPPPLSAARVLLHWQLEPLALLGLGLLAAVYCLGLVRLARRGDSWPAGRSAAFLLGGVGSAAFATMSGLAAYDDVLFSAHMAQHMILSMVTPVFLALGAPVTLALRALPIAGRRRLLAVLHSRVARALLFPVVGTTLFVLTPFALYFTPVYLATLRSPTLHVLLHAHFVAVGCLFFWPVLGVDPLPGRLPHPLRLLLLFVILPFHAFLGISIMSAGLIAPQWYDALGRTWGGSPLSDQHTGGGLLWASGDLLGLLLVCAVAAQWMRADERAARQADRRLDRDDAQLAAYNARLAALARRASTPGPRIGRSE